jgi:putative membrane protein
LLEGIPQAQRWMFGAIALGIPSSAIGAIYPSNTWLQVGPVALLLPLAVWALRRWPISNASAICITLFVMLHLIAARWSYSFVPYREWLNALGFGSDAGTGFHRNVFDRLVHFAFGFLAVIPFCELAARYGGLKRRQSLTGALLFVLAVGGLYEIFEWSLTMTLSPADAGAYNGEQGDMFDSQKDMAIAALGALMVAPVQLWLWRRG